MPIRQTRKTKNCVQVKESIYRSVWKLKKKHNEIQNGTRDNARLSRQAHG